MEFRKMLMITLYAKQKETQMYRTDFWTLWEKARVGCFERTASKHVYYLGWNRSPAQVGCMRQVLGPGALGRPRGIGWRGRWEGGSGWGIYVYPRLIYVNIWQKPLQYCKVISLQLIKKNKLKKKDNILLNTMLSPGEDHSPCEVWWLISAEEPGGKLWRACMYAQLVSHARCWDLLDSSCQAPLSMGFPKQEY